MNNRNSKNKGRRSPRRGRNIGSSLSSRYALGDGPSYAGQEKVVLRLPGTPNLLTTTVTTGVIAAGYDISTANITGFASRFGSTFDEYRILGADFMIRPVAASTGVSVAFFDEKIPAATVPTLANSQERMGRRLPNSNAVNPNVVMRWRARDLLDLQYIAIVTSTFVAAWKLYTDLANWGAPITATPLWVVEPIFIVEFRGVKST